MPFIEEPANSTEIIRPYGPGKFSTILDSYVYELSLHGTDDETGSVHEGAWYGRVNGPFTGDAWETDPTLPKITPYESVFLSRHAGCILCEDSQGFVYVDYCLTEDALNQQWRRIEENA